MTSTAARMALMGVVLDWPPGVLASEERGLSVCHLNFMNLTRMSFHQAITASRFRKLQPTAHSASAPCCPYNAHFSGWFQG